METHEIPASGWFAFFEGISRRHVGEAVRVEILREDLGVQVQLRHARLNGITAEPDAITISAGDRGDDHLDHVIARPTHVFVLEEDDAREVLAIEDADRTRTLIYLA